MAWAYVTAVPDPRSRSSSGCSAQNLPEDRFSDAAVADLYRRADPTPHDLADLGYLANVHPLELWAARFFIENPEATGAEAIRASEDARQEVYRWLFRTSRVGAQDQRIRSLLEVEAFTEILRVAAPRVPVPEHRAFAGHLHRELRDRPAALNELVGIILNDGIRLPTYRVEELHFAGRHALGDPDGSPGGGGRAGHGSRRGPHSARGHGRRGGGGDGPADARRRCGIRTGTVLAVGGKTGTGDNRFRVYAPGGRLVESRSVNRTSTFVFFIGDRYYGVISAYVPGDQADAYRFTSAFRPRSSGSSSSAIEALLAEDAAAAEAPTEPGPGGP
jgi:hypothetical protein